MTEIVLKIVSRSGSSSLGLTVNDLIIAGWTGRDRAAMEAHVAELEALGVTRPAHMPMYYRVSPARLTTATRISVSGEDSSGEIEFVLFATGGRLYVGAGSDHTDRRVEAYGVTVSKQMCDKPIAETAWPYEEVSAHWGELILRSHVVIDGRRHLYQEGRADILMSPEKLIQDQGHGPELADGTVLFGGTTSAKGGVRAAERFEGELEDPILDRRIRFGYDIRILPVLG